MNYRLTLIALWGFFATNLLAQEQLFDLNDNPVLKQVPIQKSASKANARTNLPFFDDFSTTQVFPVQELWQDNYVYINNSYAIGPPSIGVATFDAISNSGAHYPHASSETFAADTLTSAFINLLDVNLDSLYLSFYYQPQGYGNEPEKNDTLVLQLKDTANSWKTVWRANGETFLNFRRNTLHIPDEEINPTLEFALKMVHIEDAKYQHANFQFRFINYASIAGAGNPSRAVNCDHWNIDYVYLNEGRTENDTIFNDIAFVEPPTRFIRTFTSVPWDHYPSLIDVLLKTMVLHVRNNSTQTLTVAPATLYFSDLATPWKDSIKIGTDTISKLSNDKRFTWPFSHSPIEHDNRKSVDFLIEAKITPRKADIESNNTASFVQHFSNYYSYDDGSAEKIYAHNSDGGLVAYQFNIGKADTLRGVDMYFLQNFTPEDAAESFSLCVWDDDNGTPGEIRVEEAGKRPAFGDELNQFVTIKLDTAIFIERTFYIGWRQVSDRYLNLGFDKNTNSKEKIRFNFYGKWDTTSFVGSLMIRPIFGSPLTTSIRDKFEASTFNLFPNPVNQSFTISDADLNYDAIIEVYDITGKKVQENTFEGQAIAVDQLNNGVYFVNITNANKAYKAKRIIIAR